MNQAEKKDLFIKAAIERIEQFCKGVQVDLPAIALTAISVELKTIWDVAQEKGSRKA